MKDDAECVPVPGEYLADAVAQLHPIVAARAAHWSAVDSEDDGISLGEWHHGSARLHSRTLLCQHELAPCEIVQRLGEEHGDLQREDMFAIQVLVKAVVVAGTVLQQQRRWPRLAGGCASGDEFIVRNGKRTPMRKPMPMRSCH